MHDWKRTAEGKTCLVGSISPVIFESRPTHCTQRRIIWRNEQKECVQSLNWSEVCWYEVYNIYDQPSWLMLWSFISICRPQISHTCVCTALTSQLSTSLILNWGNAATVLNMCAVEILHTCVTAQQRLISEVADEVLEGCKLVKPKHIAVVAACHVKMLDWILRPVQDNYK